MVESQFATSFDGEPVKAVTDEIWDEHEKIADAVGISEIDQLKITNKQLSENLDWTSAILAVLLQEAGGAVEISKADLGAIPLKSVMAKITYQEETDTFLVEAVTDEPA